MAQKQQHSRPQVQYRVQLEKKIDINKSYSQRRNQAIALRILSYGLFGQKRYQNLYLTCSLNCFYYALKIANAIHRRVAGLAMIIRFQTAHVIQYYSEPFEGKTFGQKNYSKISIKLTKTPTQQDKKQAGYNPGLNADGIEQPLTQVIARKQRPQGQRFQRGRFQRGRGIGRGRGGYRGRYNNNREQNRDRPYRRDDRYNRNYHDNRDKRDDRKDDRQQNRTDYRKFRTYKDQQPQEDQNRRGERKTRGSYNNNYHTNYRNNQRDNQDKTFNRRRYQNKQNRGEQRGERGPRRRYNRDDDEQ